ncbi:MAG: 3-deoxy-manno-octulosonate cytidylyltransferase [Chlamydiae bacterium]|nr:3-deoxy-manno-octulosonate cytidylyltransferase [Chlamydiota bacterium]MBI3276224.1 3-deoxy-manno-octulosonate cytidylyltransferase [Chlamydiota bacterium]
MKVVIGIPVRMGSSRFPGKPLAKILGISMIEHVYKRCLLVKHVDDVFVAACDEAIRQTVLGFGGKVYMTHQEISRPALRVAEACRKQNLADDDIVVVVQGDEPLIHPGMIDLAIAPLLADPKVQILTLVADANEKEWLDPNEVKVVVDEREDILFMSRSSIPSNIRDRIGPRLKQVAIMPFRKKFLLDFQEMSATPYEIAESIELLRAVEHGIKVRTAKSPYRSVSVDTEPDRQEAERAMRRDEFYPSYAGRRQEMLAGDRDRKQN